MAYSTGSGDYLALMAAVLAHAVTDGWVEAGGIGTGWPISKGNVRGIDWATDTVAATDYTNGAAVPKTARFLKLAAGTSPANATANAAGSIYAHVPNMEYNFDAWHIFSDPSLCDYIHVVVQFTNGIDAQGFGHFSFGEIFKHGMGYTAIAYTSAHPVRGFSPNNVFSNNQTNDAHSGVYGRIRRIFTGNLGWFSFLSFFTVGNPVTFIVDPTVNPFPVSGVWPTPDVLYDSSSLLDSYGPSSGSFFIDSDDPGVKNAKFSHNSLFTISQPYSGGVSLGPIPLFIANSTSNISSLRFINVGSFPNVRLCSLANLLAGDEITYASDTWKVFPFVARKERSTLGQQYKVSSAFYGLAYKKVI